MKKVLVTGGSGFIGSHLVDELVNKYETYVFDNHLPGFGNKTTNPKAKLITGDVRRYEDIEFAMKNIDVVIHLAALSHVTTCRENPKLAFDINTIGTLNILEVARKSNGIGRIIHAGTDHIYGSKNYKYQPIDELHPHNALFENDIYGKSKAMGVNIAQTYYGLYGLPIVITTSGNVFSERQSVPNVIPNFIKAALNNQDLIIHGDGEQTRDFYHVNNLVDGYIKCIETPNIEGEIFNFGGENEITINKLGKKILELIPKSKSKIIHISNEDGHNIMEKMSLNINKAKDLLGYRIILDFEDGLKRTIEAYRNNL